MPEAVAQEAEVFPKEILDLAQVLAIEALLRYRWIEALWGHRGVEDELSRLLGVEHDARVAQSPGRQGLAQENSHAVLHHVHRPIGLVQALRSQRELRPVALDCHAELHDLAPVPWVTEHLEAVIAHPGEEAEVHGLERVRLRRQVRPREEELRKEGCEHVRLALPNGGHREELKIGAALGRRDNLIEALVDVRGEFPTQHLWGYNGYKKTQRHTVLEVRAEVFHRAGVDAGELHITPAQQKLLRRGSSQGVIVLLATQQRRGVLGRLRGRATGLGLDLRQHSL
mmetsp:Transcript_17691/g.37594  ORF Transcript_17691/g.37594 Transcript_17691/m.37594 type:complete len:284 (+) Transcript_17691:877-1728(+)